MKKTYKSILVSTLLFTIFSCNTDFETDLSQLKPTQGEANFTRYVSLGNSLTSGFRDGALFLDGQNESYPSIIAMQMQKAGGGTFKQPLMPNNIGGFNGLGIDGKLTLKLINGALSPIPSAAGGVLDNISSGGPYQNLGIPGAKSYHLVPLTEGTPYPQQNPYYSRFAMNSTSNPLADAVAQNPTFFSLWIGNNDVLGYATSGGDGSDVITSTAVFSQAYTTLVNGLTANGAKGVLANLPDVTTIPFFTTVPAKPISGLSSSDAATLNQAYLVYNNGIAAMRTAGVITEEEYQKRFIKFDPNVANGAVIRDKGLTDLSTRGLPSFRQTTSNDLILLKALSLMKDPAVLGGTKTPLDDKYVLTESEVLLTKNAVASFNSIIKSLADANGLAFVDANAKMKELATQSGMMFDGVRYTATFVTGGAFSLDGVHLTGRGYAVIANEFIKSINGKYKSTLAFVNPNHYSGVKFP